MTDTNKYISSILAWLVICTAIFVSGCGGSKTVKTKDDSADYQAARSLPPLKKDLGRIRSGNGTLANRMPATVQAPEAEVSDTTADSPRPSVAASNNDSVEPDSRVVKIGDKTARLQIDADIDQAWLFLSESLIDSSITIHNRNRDAGRISIGCGDLESADEVKASGSWSIFSRKKASGLEYCALQLEKDKGATVVKVFNRSALEVEAAAAEGIFQRILGN